MEKLLSTLWKKTKQGRLLSQLIFLSLAFWVAILMFFNVRGATIERYCPFGGVETLIPWFSQKGTFCNLSTVNISMLAGLLVLTVLFKRVFCSHICPLGTLLEWIGKISRRFIIGSRKISDRPDKALKWLKYPLLAVILFFTVKAGELVFRNFDPYYLFFTGGTGHGIGKTGIWILLGVIIIGILAPLSFCKYLCPMAACFAPFCRIGVVRVVRNDKLCAQCGSCNAACEWGITVSKTNSVSNSECSNCQDCIRACPTPGSLALQIRRSLR